MELSELLAQVQTFQTVMKTELAGLAKKDDVDNRIRTISKSVDELTARFMKPGAAGGDNGTGEPSIGELFTASDEYKTFLHRQCKGRAVFPLQNGLWGNTKTAVTQTAVGWSTPGVLTPQRGPGIVPGARRQLRIRDLLQAFPCDSGAIEYVRESALVNAASPQVEASDKGESAITFEVVSARIPTIATWIPISKQAAADVQSLSNHINSTLMYCVKLKEETQILIGDGTGENMDGIVHQATAYNTSLNASGDTKLDKLRHAIFQAESAERGPVDGIILNPKDAHDIDLIKSEEGGANKGRYIAADPLGGVMTVKTLWSVPLIESFSQPAGTFTVGGFQTGAELRDRQQAIVEISEEHSDYWVKNMLAVRAEERCVVLVKVPAVFVTGAF